MLAHGSELGCTEDSPIMPEILTISQGATSRKLIAGKRGSKRLLRAKESAAYLGISPDTLRTLVWKGELPVVRYNEHAPFLFDVEDLDRFIERHKVTF